MKKLFTVGLAGLLVAAMLAPATAGKAKPQVVEGTIAAPVRHPDGCYTGLARHLWSLFGESSNGAVGYTFDVDKATWKGKFTLDGTAAAGNLDLDISYYLGDFATQAEFLADPAPAAPAVVEYTSHDGIGEAGTVPEFAVKAIVCVYAAETGQGSVGASFKYTAAPPVAKKKKR